MTVAYEDKIAACAWGAMEAVGVSADGKHDLCFMEKRFNAIRADYEKLHRLVPQLDAAIEANNGPIELLKEVRSLIEYTF